MNPKAWRMVRRSAQVLPAAGLALVLSAPAMAQKAQAPAAPASRSADDKTGKPQVRTYSSVTVVDDPKQAPPLPTGRKADAAPPRREPAAELQKPAELQRPREFEKPAKEDRPTPVREEPKPPREQLRQELRELRQELREQRAKEHDRDHPADGLRVPHPRSSDPSGRPEPGQRPERLERPDRVDRLERLRERIRQNRD